MQKSSLGLFLSTFLMFSTPCWAQNSISIQTDTPVQFAADQLSYQQDGEILIATGSVYLEQLGRIVEADQLTYDIVNDTVEAQGNVRLTDIGGDVLESDYIVLRDSMKNGLIKHLKGTMADDSRFWAGSAEKKEGRIVLEDARYTPCKACLESERDFLRRKRKVQKEEAPDWQIKAKKVVWDQEENVISYKHAKFEVGGVPVFYTPYFRHPDGTIDQKSGILRPEFGFRSQLGTFYDQTYYWGIDEDKDATIGAILATQQNPVGTAEYRQNFGSGTFEISGSATQSDRIDDVNGVNVTEEDDFRGHLFANLRWDLNQNWRSGFDINLTTDEQYLRQYDFDEDLENDDILTSSLFAERFDGRHYARGRLLSFQDVRVTQFANSDQPIILPFLEASFVGEANQTFGGRWGWRGSALNFVRDGNGQDVTRFVGIGEWERRFVAPIGLVTTATATSRLDSFFIRDSDPFNLDPNTPDNDEAVRFFPQMHLVSQYPLAKNVKGGHMLVEPIAALTVAPNIDNNSAIPNEDSADTQLNITNLFDDSRFTGLDLIEDRSRATYGLKTGFYSDDGDYFDFFFGQSYRFDDDDNPFSAGSGLSDQNSDFVGAVRANLFDSLRFNYRYQYDGRNFQARRHEATIDYDRDKYGLSSNYLFLDAVATTGFTDSREQVAASGYWYASPRWRLNTTNIYDLGVERNGLLRAAIGVDYFSECYSVSLQGERNFVDESSGESDFNFTMRVGLKNLSGFANSKFQDRIVPCK